MVAALAFGIVCWSDPAGAASRPAVLGSHGMVVAPEAHAARVGVEVLRGGGNAVDAAVAVAFMLAVTDPPGGNLGGGGFLLYRDAGGQHRALDFREVAPSRLRPGHFLDEDGRPLPGSSLRGGLAVGVPGSVAGLARAHELWGSRPWPELLAPAIRFAEEGFAVYPALAELLEREEEKLRAFPETRRIFLGPGGTAPPAGFRLVQRDLARSLRKIARRRAAGLYRGPVAEAIAATVEAEGGLISLADLAAYRPLLREPLEGRFRGHRVVTFPPPSSGGVALLQMLAILERYDLQAMGPGSSLAIHLVAEAARRAFADRSRWLGDPQHFNVPVARLLEPDYLEARTRDLRPDRITPSRALLPGEPLARADGQTLHISVADEQGRAVALTTTLNAWFGCGIVARGTGILLNNEMDDFALAPGVPNLYGLLGGRANAVAGGKRPLSSMTPTIVESPTEGGRPALVLGSPGGATIISAVLQVLLNVVEHRMPLQEAVDAPRFHHQWHPDHLRYETRGLPEDVRVELIRRGHELRHDPTPIGNVNAIGINSQGSWLGAADPRRQGSAVGY